MTITKCCPVGRPMKYDHYIRILEDETVYTPATIVQYGIEQGLFPRGLSEDEAKKVRFRIRHTLARFSTNHGFPDDGDGWITMPGQPPMRGWRGRRWKDALPIL